MPGSIRRVDPYEPHLVPIARTLRRDATVPERLLWSRLRGRRLGVRFLRQHPLLGYVADFCCPEARLVVEVDGRSHDGRGDADRARQSDIEALGYRVLRLSNDDVVRDLDAAAARVAEMLR